MYCNNVKCFNLHVDVPEELCSSLPTADVKQEMCRSETDDEVKENSPKKENILKSPRNIFATKASSKRKSFDLNAKKDPTIVKSR